MLKFSEDKLEELFALIAGGSELYLPIEKSEQVQFSKWSSGETVRLDKLNTVKSAKDLFFPQSENLVDFKIEKQKISIIEDRDETAPFVVFGVRACDAASFDILDKVFLAEPVDSYYKTRRENATVVTLACGSPEETCFCSAFGIDSANPKGDVETFICNGVLYWNSLTEKGDALTKKVTEIMEKADATDEAKLSEYKGSIKEIMEKLPYHSLSLEGFNEESLNEIFNSQKWEKLSEACLGCGTCTFVCPTCQCYDIRDYDTGHGIKRFRCWDSCLYSDFTKMAAANPRTTQMQRFRQRFMHKLVYFPANNEGTYGCVGCGRCVNKCPVSMNLVKVVKALGGSENE